MTPKYVGDVVKLGRLRAGLTQEQAGQEFGVPRHTIARWERGHDLDVVARFLDYFLRISEVSALATGRGRSRGVRVSELPLPRAHAFASEAELEVAVHEVIERVTGRRVRPSGAGPM